MQAVVGYLAELGIKDADLHNTVEKFPEVLGLQVKERMKVNVEKIEREFKIKGPELLKMFKRKPQALGKECTQLGLCKTRLSFQLYSSFQQMLTIFLFDSCSMVLPHCSTALLVSMRKAHCVQRFKFKLFACMSTDC